MATVHAIEWEVLEIDDVSGDISGETCRLPVPGGWLYRTVCARENRAPIGLAMVFVPNPASPDQPV
jgi:hypothetical protein